MKLNVNGKDRVFDAPADMPWLWVLRDLLNLTGTKYGCGESLCGACTVHVDGQAVRSCTTTAASVAGKKVITIEGLSSGASHPCQKAWAEGDVVQCGYCQSGQIMQAAALLASLRLKDRKHFKIIGKSQKRLDTPEKITGGAKFGIDVQLPGLLTAVVARPPTFGGKARSFKADAALTVPGVKKVVEVPTGVAVVARHMWAAMKGREALEVD